MAAGLAGAALLSACGAGDGDQAGASGAAGNVPPDAPALAEGLLPAEAFGPDATVVDVSPEQLAAGAGPATGADVQVAPPECAPLLDLTGPPDVGYEEVAAQSALQGGTSTVQVLVRGAAATSSVDGLADAVSTCPEATLTSPEFGEARVTFELLPADGVGGEAVAVRYTTVVQDPETGPVTVPVLVGMAEDGDRQLTLLRVTTDGTEPDPAAFADLFSRAYSTQAEALG
ncbi:hypothetical protein OF117_01965 [Geodermatophilus sp. YIM 151500]|uniref:hypothetical protein n=1 Tax=Geodermatophilus sp. YIM 151500 TaxID=2984531 RepID=UPI0021E4C7DA|nr:hypothetical protein [Geodermatophilus sp. YIM 151500]MCV2488117.1 hypothetical protein [Geodermatophilus sp. YIM 151500]